MTTYNAEALFNSDFCGRIQQLRKARGWTQEQMATALGVPVDRYRKYKIRSPLPMYLVEQFALAVNEDVAYVVTGKSRKRAEIGQMRRSA